MGGLALALRAPVESGHDRAGAHAGEDDVHDVLHDFAEAIERLMSAGLLVLLGGAIVGGVLGPLGYQGVIVGVAVVLLIRPLSGLVSLVGHRCPGHERSAIAFFGIRGMGSGYYLAYALNEADFAQAEELWAILVFVVLLSVVLHGVSASPVMARLDRRTERKRQPAHGR